MRAMAMLFALSLGIAPAAVAQTLGTFTWRLEPYCNVVHFTVTPDGAAYRLTGFDDQCGAGQVPAAGVVTPNVDGTFTLVFYLVGADGRAGHTTATLAPGNYSGPWSDDGGLAGTARFGAAPSPAGTPRPVVAFQRRVSGTCPSDQFVREVLEDGSVDCGSAAGGGGDITAVMVGNGLTGGGTSGDVMLGIAAGGVGSLEIADGTVGASDVNPAQVQRRLTTSCSGATYMTGILESGVPSCGQGSTIPSVTALGGGALGVNTGGGNTAVGMFALGSNTSGFSSTAMGTETLRSNITGDSNTAMGFQALRTSSTGRRNTAVGAYALYSATSAESNSALGAGALYYNQTGNSNVAVGRNALNQNMLGGSNTAVGSGALSNTTGAGNIAIGSDAGGNLTNGILNIAIGHPGIAGETQTTRIGESQTRTFISGIRGVTPGTSGAIAVLIDSNGQLGTVSSSRRTKEDIRDMGDASAGLFRLRPVAFRYIQPYADGSKPLDYGLIAEEVAEVYPDLVVRDQAGEAETVQYHKLVPMLLNELQRQQREIERQRHALDELRSALAVLSGRFDGSRP
ncbi:MAG: tail fiber domain-containing protein [Acidobacteria bacterium]|nr:tail fiber domain-containing protein [Acidobacteriota bacterium]